MSRPLLILKTGSTVSLLRSRRGDFEDWFRAGLGLSAEQAPVLEAERAGAFPDPRTLRGIVVTGSPAMVTERPEWSTRSGAWLADAVRGGTPTLAVCYGHQLLADALGGEVGWTPAGREIGTVTVELTSAAESDVLLRGLSSPLTVQTSHSQSVLRLPEGARRLAGNRHDPNQAFAWGPAAWAVQFHPEFDADIVRGYLRARRDEIRAEGIDPDPLLERTSDSPEAALIVRRFAAFAACTKG